MQPDLIAVTPAVEDIEAAAAAEDAEAAAAAEDEHQEQCFDEAPDLAPKVPPAKRTPSARHVSAVLQQSSGKQK